MILPSGIAGSMNSNCCYGASFLSVGSAFLCISFTLNFLHPPESTQPQRRSLAAPGFNTQSLSRNESLFFSGIRTLIGPVWVTCPTLGQSLCLRSEGSYWPIWVTCPPRARWWTCDVTEPCPPDDGGQFIKVKHGGCHRDKGVKESRQTKPVVCWKQHLYLPQQILR